MLQRMLELPEPRPSPATTCARCASSPPAAPRCPATSPREVMDRFGDVLYNLYGSTEVAWATIATPAGPARRARHRRPPAARHGRQAARRATATRSPTGETGPHLRRQRDGVRGLHRRRRQGGHRRPDVHRRRRPLRRGRAPVRRRPRRRDDRLGRRERLPARGRGPARRPRRRSRRSRSIGVDDEQFGQRLRAFVVLRARARPRRGRRSRPTSRRTSPATRCRARSSSSTSCRATRPARCSSASSRGLSPPDAPRRLLARLEGMAASAPTASTSGGCGSTPGEGRRLELEVPLDGFELRRPALRARARRRSPVVLDVSRMTRRRLRAAAALRGGARRARACAAWSRPRRRSRSTRARSTSPAAARSSTSPYVAGEVLDLARLGARRARARACPARCCAATDCAGLCPVCGGGSQRGRPRARPRGRAGPALGEAARAQVRVASRPPPGDRVTQRATTAPLRAAPLGTYGAQGPSSPRTNTGPSGESARPASRHARHRPVLAGGEEVDVHGRARAASRARQAHSSVARPPRRRAPRAASARRRVRRAKARSSRTSSRAAVRERVGRSTRVAGPADVRGAIASATGVAGRRPRRDARARRGRARGRRCRRRRRHGRSVEARRGRSGASPPGRSERQDDPRRARRRRRRSAASSSRAADAAALEVVGDGEQREAPDALAHERQRDADDLAVALGDPAPPGSVSQQVARSGRPARRARASSLAGGRREQRAARDGVGGRDVARRAAGGSCDLGRASARKSSTAAMRLPFVVAMAVPKQKQSHAPHRQAPRHSTRSARRRTTRARSATARAARTGSARCAAPTAGARS